MHLIPPAIMRQISGTAQQDESDSSTQKLTWHERFPPKIQTPLPPNQEGTVSHTATLSDQSTRATGAAVNTLFFF